MSKKKLPAGVWDKVSPQDKAAYKKFADLWHEEAEPENVVLSALSHAYDYAAPLSPCVNDRMYPEHWAPGINLDSEQARGLICAVPCWEGSGRLRDYVSGNRQTLAPTAHQSYRHNEYHGTHFSTLSSTSRIIIPIGERYYQGSLNGISNYTIFLRFKYENVATGNILTLRYGPAYGSTGANIHLSTNVLNFFKGGGSYPIHTVSSQWIDLFIRSSYLANVEAWVNGNYNLLGSFGSNLFVNAIELSQSAGFRVNYKDIRIYNRPLTEGEMQRIDRHPSELWAQPSVAYFTADNVVTTRGGLLFGSNTTFQYQQVHHPTGGLLFGSDTTMVAGAVHVPSGGLNIGSNSTFVLGYAYVPSGGLLFGGTQNVIRHSTVAGDSLRIYHTDPDATAEGDPQPDQTASLGGYRSGTQAERIGFLQSSAGHDVSVLSASGQNQTGVGSIIAIDGTGLAYTAPGSSTQGTIRNITSGRTILEDGDDPSKWVQIRRDSTSELIGVANLEFVPQFHNVFGMSDSVDKMGEDVYRAVILRSEGGFDITSTKAYIGQLGTAVTGIVQGLDATSSTGTITAAADSFCDWPHRGWCRIEDSTNGLLEIVYYGSRTDTALTVSQRACLDTTAQDSDDTANKLYAVPPLKIALESVDATGAIQTIADETTAPTGLTWTTGIRAADGLDVGTLEPDGEIGLWLHRKLFNGVAAIAQAENLVMLTYDFDGRYFGYTDATSYTERLGGLYRIGDTSLERYELHIGRGSEPDLDGTPDETFTSLPHDTTSTLDASSTHYLTTNYRNRFNLVSRNVNTTKIVLDGTAEVTPPPSAPEQITASAGLAGVINVTAVYFLNADTTSQRADQWIIRQTFDSTAPTAADSIDYTATIVDAGGFAFLDYDTSAQANGTVGRFLVRVRRSSDSVESDNTATVDATASTTGPNTSGLRGYYRKVAESKA